MKALIFGILILSAQAQAKSCIYVSVSNSAKMEWTAFKTTQKVAVKGTFKDLQLVKPNNKKEGHQSLEEWMENHSFSINVKTVDTQNAARDKTLYEHFFSLMKTSLDYLPGDIFMTGKIKKVDRKKSELIALLGVNGQKHEVPFKYSYTNETLEITGTTDLLKLGLEKAHASLHKACFELHKGEDGVSKTWTEVELKGQVQIKEVCI